MEKIKLNEEQMREFEKKLEAPPKVHEGLRRLLQEPSVLDAQEAVNKAAEESELDDGR